MDDHVVIISPEDAFDLWFYKFFVEGKSTEEAYIYYRDELKRAFLDGYVMGRDGRLETHE